MAGNAGNWFKISLGPLKDTKQFISNDALKVFMARDPEAFGGATTIKEAKARLRGRLAEGWRDTNVSATDAARFTEQPAGQARRRVESKPERNERGPKGFTNAKPIRDALRGKFATGSYTSREDRVRNFSGVTADGMQQIAGALPPKALAERQNDAPTVKSFGKLAQEFPEARFDGYRVGPGNSDERISIDTITVPASQAAAVRRRLGRMELEDAARDETAFTENGRDLVRFFYD